MNFAPKPGTTRSETALFLIAALVCLVSVFASGVLTDTHVRTRPTAEAWRLRRATAPIPSVRRRG